MMKYLLFTKDTYEKNVTMFNICNHVANGYHRYPNDAGTTTYTVPINHPDGIQIALCIYETDNTEILWNKYRELFQEEPIILDKLTDDWYPADLLNLKVSINA